ncbi:MAG: uncharacterized protein JWN72_1138 [Thermoleophilia bacterium]|nr:uncharacterized protein [Thermoleophilia bacterium]
MAELTQLESKIGEVIGLAQAATGATEKIGAMIEDESVKAKLQQMHDDSVEIADRGEALVASETYAGKKTAILEQARETKGEVTEMMSTYLGDDADGLDGLEFLTMAEAGEVGHWKILATLNEQLGDSELKQLTDYAIPLEEQHFQVTLDSSLVLAGEIDANETA